MGVYFSPGSALIPDVVRDATLVHLVSRKVAAVPKIDEIEVQPDEESMAMNNDERPESIQLKKLDKFHRAFQACSAWRNLFMSFRQVQMCEEELLSTMKSGPASSLTRMDN
jgi:hypothetical protein